MNHRKTLLSAGLAIAGVVMAMAPVAQAGLPKALDHASPDSAIVIATPKLDQLDANLSQLAAMVGWNEMTTPREGLAAIGLRDGLNMDGSAAIILAEANIDEEEPAAVVILPISNYDTLLGAFNVNEGVGGAPDSMVIQGETVFARDLGNGFAAFGPIADLVAGVSEHGGNLAAFTQRLGATCLDALDGCDIIVVGNVAKLEPLIDEGLSQIPENQEMQIDEAELEALKDSVDMLAMGLRAGALGAGLEFALRFKDETPFAGLMTGKGDSSKLLKSLPAGQMVAAFAMDYAHPGMKAMNEMNMQEQAQMGGNDIGMVLAEAFKTATGNAGVIQFNPAGLMGGGMLANTVVFYETGAPGKLMDAVTAALDSVAVPGLTMSVNENATSVDGSKVHEWSADIAPQGMAGAQMMQASTMLFGAQGIGGYMAANDNGVYFTMSRNVGLMGSALAADGANSLASDAMLRQVADQLPDNRVAEGYLNALPVLQQLMPMAAMMGLPMQGINLPRELPPVGGSVEADNASLRFTAYVPTPVIKLSAQIAEKAAALLPEAGGGAVDQQRSTTPPF